MLISILIVLVLFIILVIIGFPIVCTLLSENDPKEYINFISIIAFSLIGGFGVSALSAATAYGFFGIDNYFYILVGITLTMWLIVFGKWKNIDFKLVRKYSGMDILVFVPMIFSLYLVKSQSQSITKPMIQSGMGPDTSQNLMAGLNADKLGNTWFESFNSIKQFLNVTNFNDAALNLFRIPSSSDLAVYDYLVFGGRWGLTVPANQISKIVGPKFIFWENSIVLLLSLISFSIVFFAMGKILSKSYLIPTLLSLTVISNSAFMYQYLNGGLSQALGTISISGLILISVIIVNYDSVNDNNRLKFGIFLLATFSWLGALISYIDSLFVIMASLAITTVLMFFQSIKLFKRFFAYLMLPGIAALIITPVFTYTNLLNFRLRIKAASGTGLISENWRLPTEQLGLLNTFSNTTNSAVTKIFSFLITIMLGVLIIKYALKKNKFNAIGVGAFIVVSIGFCVSRASNQNSSYIYEKVTTYLSPLIIVYVFALFSSVELVKKQLPTKIYIYSICLIAVISAINFQETYFKNSNVIRIPNVYMSLIEDKALQEYLSKSNYLIPYKFAYNYMGFFGASNWISKAPNDFILTERINFDLRLLCFSSDASCNPRTARIKNDKLRTDYGIVIYESPITTLEFSKLNIDERFNVNFDVFGMDRVNISNKFKGGNPYFK